MITENRVKNAYECSQAAMSQAFSYTLRVFNVFVREQEHLSDEAARELIFGAMQHAYEAGYEMGISDYHDHWLRTQRAPAGNPGTCPLVDMEPEDTATDGEESGVAGGCR